MPKFKGWVVKLGGSLAYAPALKAWLNLLICARTPCVVVPGGGAFTAATREAQHHWQFGEPAAHRMAILGMTQFGLMLQALEARFAVATSLPALHARCARHGATLWLPSLEDITVMGDLPADWSVSADSIALWVAGQIGAEGLAFIKAIAPASLTIPQHASAPARVRALAAAGFVDTYLPTLQQRVGCRLEFYGCDEIERATAALG